LTGIIHAENFPDGYWLVSVNFQSVGKVVVRFRREIYQARFSFEVGGRLDRQEKEKKGKKRIFVFVVSHYGIGRKSILLNSTIREFYSTTVFERLHVRRIDSPDITQSAAVPNVTHPQSAEHRALSTERRAQRMHRRHIISPHSILFVIIIVIISNHSSIPLGLCCTFHELFITSFPTLGLLPLLTI
jgi:hypothetical protein